MATSAQKVIIQAIQAALSALVKGVNSLIGTLDQAAPAPSPTPVPAPPPPAPVPPPPAPAPAPVPVPPPPAPPPPAPVPPPPAPAPSPTPSPAPAPGSATRPAGNTGTGFFVVGKKLYDATGAEFVIRGVNKAHFDTEQYDIVKKMGANACRWFLYEQASTLSAQVAACREWIARKVVPIAANNDIGPGDASAANLSRTADLWIAQAAAWKPFERHLIVNLLNEWGPDGGTVWRDAYISAVQRMRAAGYLGTLMIDAGGYGQSADTLISYAEAVQAADPQHNCVFSIHIYGNFSNPATQSWQVDYKTAMAKLAALSVPVLVGEFGPGKNVGPSPTDLTPGTIIGTADSNGWGWLAWAADDGNTDNSFGMLYDNFKFESDGQLTQYGRDVVSSTYGLRAKAAVAKVFA